MFICKDIDDNLPVPLRPGRLFFTKFKEGTEIYERLYKYLTERRDMVEELLEFKYNKLYPLLGSHHLNTLTSIYNMFMNIKGVRGNLKGNNLRLLFQEHFIQAFLDDIKYIDISRDYYEYCASDEAIKVRGIYNIENANDFGYVIKSIEVAVLSSDSHAMGESVETIKYKFIKALKNIVKLNYIICEEENLAFASGVVPDKIDSPRNRMHYFYCLGSGKFKLSGWKDVFTAKTSCGNKIFHARINSDLNREYREIKSKYSDISWKELSEDIYKDILIVREDIENGDSFKKEATTVPNIVWDGKSEDVYLIMSTTGHYNWSKKIINKNLANLIGFAYSGEENSMYVPVKSSFEFIDGVTNILTMNTEILEAIEIVPNSILMAARDAIGEEYNKYDVDLSNFNAEDMDKKVFKLYRSVSTDKDFGIKIPENSNDFMLEIGSQFSTFTNNKIEKVVIGLIGLLSGKIRNRRTYILQNDMVDEYGLPSIGENSRLKYRFQILNEKIRSKTFVIENPHSYTEILKGGMHESDSVKLITKITECKYYQNDPVLLDIDGENVTQSMVRFKKIYA